MEHELRESYWARSGKLYLLSAYTKGYCADNWTIGGPLYAPFGLQFAYDKHSTIFHCDGLQRVAAVSFPPIDSSVTKRTRNQFFHPTTVINMYSVIGSVVFNMEDKSSCCAKLGIDFSLGDNTLLQIDRLFRSSLCLRALQNRRVID